MKRDSTIEEHRGFHDWLKPTLYRDWLSSLSCIQEGLKDIQSSAHNATLFVDLSLNNFCFMFIKKSQCVKKV